MLSWLPRLVPALDDHPLNVESTVISRVILFPEILAISIRTIALGDITLVYLGQLFGCQSLSFIVLKQIILLHDIRMISHRLP
jgi:hypothetical protein